MLSFRSLTVRLDGKKSTKNQMDAGVPQGSVVGPILFNVYTCDIPVNNVIEISQFADDTTIHLVHKDPARVQKKINNYLLSLVNWFRDWKLKINEDKTDLIHILGQQRDTGATLNLEKQLD